MWRLGIGLFTSCFQLSPLNSTLALHFTNSVASTSLKCFTVFTLSSTRVTVLFGLLVYCSNFSQYARIPASVCSFHRDTPGLPRGKATKHALEEAHHDALRELVRIHASLPEVTEELGLGRERL